MNKEFKEEEINKQRIDGVDYVVCAICGNEFKQIAAAHLKLHNITFEEYLDRYPDRLWRCGSLQEQMTENQIKSQYSNEKNKCKVCGKDIKWNRTFCSISCASRFRKSPLISKNCLKCGKQFYVSVYSDTKFCSRVCYDNFRKSSPLSRNNFKETIKKKYGYQCVLCNHFENLRVHHIDENSKNNNEENLILLCESCHRYNHNGIYMTVFRKFEVDLAHQLPKHPSCSYLHGHSVKIEIGIKGKLDLQTGMIIDFKELKQIVNKVIIDKFDHSYMNDRIPNPTAENFTWYIFKSLKECNLDVKVVRVFETKNNYIEYMLKSKESMRVD